MPMADMSPSAARLDPRPPVEADRIVGVRCTSCAHPSAAMDERCRRCGGGVAHDRFGPLGSLWAVADVHLRVGHRSPPFTLAYVDIDDGPRVLATVRGPVPDDDRVVIVGSDEGDIVVEAAR